MQKLMVILSAVMANWSTGARAEVACVDVISITVPNARIVSSTAVRSGDKILGASGLDLGVAGTAFCRVSAILSADAQSSIGVELWLPAADRWNGKFLASGNGGFGGSLIVPAFSAMHSALRRGYATAGNDLGHTAQSPFDSAWARDHPSQILDYGFRADHQTAIFAKYLIEAFYGKRPFLSYFQGCSNGGREALMEAQRFPNDYDAIIAGAPGYNWTALMTDFLWNMQAVLREPDSMIGPSGFATIQAYVLGACGDPGEGGILLDPVHCRVDFSNLRCSRKPRRDCLSDAQLAALQQVQNGPKGSRIYPGFPQATDAYSENWDQWIFRKNGLQAQLGEGFFQNMVYPRQTWDYRTADIDKAAEDARRQLAAVVDASDPNLSAFAARGGKLLLYHGWSDAAISPLATLDYYRRIGDTLGAPKRASFVRLFLLPGVEHCYGGPGASNFDVLSLLESWRERDQAPVKATAIKFDNDEAVHHGARPGAVVRSGLLCAFPRVARKTEVGSPKEADTYRCVAPARR